MVSRRWLQSTGQVAAKTRLSLLLPPRAGIRTPLHRLYTFFIQYSCPSSKLLHIRGTRLNVACSWALREVSDQYMGFRLKWVWLRQSTWVHREWISSLIPLRTPASSRPESNFLSDQTKPHATSGKNENIFREDHCNIRLLQDIRDSLDFGLCRWRVKKGQS